MAALLAKGDIEPDAAVFDDVTGQMTTVAEILAAASEAPPSAAPPPAAERLTAPVKAAPPRPTSAPPRPIAPRLQPPPAPAVQPATAHGCLTALGWLAAMVLAFLALGAWLGDDIIPANMLLAAAALTLPPLVKPLRASFPRLMAPWIRIPLVVIVAFWAFYLGGSSTPTAPTSDVSPDASQAPVVETAADASPEAPASLPALSPE